MNNKQERKEYTTEEKLDFVTNNLKVTFWCDKELIKEFDQICKNKGVSRKDGILKLMSKFVEKQNKKG